MLALAGGCYQGVFRNPLADPYLLGVAAGAGLGGDRGDRAAAASRRAAARPGCRSPSRWPRSSARSVAVALTYLLGAAGGRDRVAGHADPGRGGGVGVPHRRADVPPCSGTSTRIREVYSWLLGRLATAGWHDVLLLLPYAVVTAVVVLAAPAGSWTCSRVGDEEAASLGRCTRSAYPATC